MPSILLHIGYPKTGTTWLQKSIFADPKTGFESPWSYEGRTEFVLMNSFRFSPQSARATFQPGIDAARDNGRLAVLTDEWLTGNQISAQYHGKEVADRLAATFPDGVVLVLFREQCEMIVSSYREYVKVGGSLPIEEFVGKGQLRGGFEPNCRLDHLEYDLLIDYYQRLFGRERVMAVPFEWMRKSPSDFFGALWKLCETSGTFNSDARAENVGLRGVGLGAMRALHSVINAHSYATPYYDRRKYLLRSFGDALARLKLEGLDSRAERSLRARVSVLIEGLYGESNRRTAELTGMELGPWGYQV